MAHDELPDTLGPQPDGSIIFYTSGRTGKELWDALQYSGFTSDMEDVHLRRPSDFTYRTWGPADDRRTHLTPQNEAAQLWLMTNYPETP